MKLRTRRRSKFPVQEETDPLSVVVNVFDVAMVFAVALMVAMVMHLNMTEVFTPSEEQSPDKTKGKRVGIAYELENGEIIYVPE
jgi:hypothetical protein